MKGDHSRPLLINEEEGSGHADPIVTSSHAQPAPRGVRVATPPSTTSSGVDLLEQVGTEPSHAMHRLHRDSSDDDADVVTTVAPKDYRMLKPEEISNIAMQWLPAMREDDILDQFDDIHTFVVKDLIFFIALTVIAGCHILTALRIDGVIDWTWRSVFVPQLIGSAVALGGLIFYILWSAFRLNTIHWVRKKFIRLGMVIIGCLLVILFFTFLQQRLDYGKEMSVTFLVAFTPLYFVQIVALGRWTSRWWRKHKKHQQERVDLHERALWEPGPRFKRFMFLILQVPLLVFTVVLALKLDDRLPTSSTWFVVFTPLWIFLPMLIIAICFNAGRAGLADVMFALIGLLVFVTPVFLFAYFLCKRLEGQNDWPFSLISLPVFIMYGLLFIGRFCWVIIPLIIAYFDRL